MDVRISHKSSKPRKKRRWSHWLVEILIVIIVLFAVRTWQQHGMVSGEAPEIMLEDLSGKTVSLNDYKGKPLLLHFWATWCHICEFEQSWINEINKDWTVLTVMTLSPDTSKEALQRYMKQHKIQHWQTIIDKDNSLAEHYGITAVPSTFVIDSNGEIRFKEVGITTPWGWRLRLWLTDLIDG